MLKCILLLAILFVCYGNNQLIAQPNYDLYAVLIKDKEGTSFSVFRPQAYLSAAALQRRAIQGICINEQDLPIPPSYLIAIANQGVQITQSSKWLNLVLIHTTDKEQLSAIANLAFVEDVLPVGQHRPIRSYKRYTKRLEVDSSQFIANHYGHAAFQIEQMQGDFLHQLGYRGQAVQVAVADGGFSNAYRTGVFDSVYQTNRLWGTKDFVDGDDWVYQNSTHGTGVWSTMAANTPQMMVGTAPASNYYLLRTEDTQNELPVEEIHWVIAMEYADSVGVEVVNSSLGYSVYRDKSKSYTYADMNGKNTWISQGAAIATQKGMLLVNAAGNDGKKEWKYLFAPSDVTDVLTVGAVDAAQQKANFSGWGPTADGRLKPDVAALGVSTVLTSIVTYGVAYGDGTSYASPVLCGLVASLKSAFPLHQNTAIRQAITESGHLHSQPNTGVGYGVPNFEKAYFILQKSILAVQESSNKIRPFFDKQFTILLQQQKANHIDIQIKNSLEKVVFSQQIIGKQLPLQKINLSLEHLPKGCYILQLNLDNKIQYFQLFKN